VSPTSSETGGGCGRRLRGYGGRRQHGRRVVVGAAEREGQRVGDDRRARTTRGVALQHPGKQLGPQRRQVVGDHRILRESREDLRRTLGAGECARPGESLEQHEAEGVDVGCRGRCMSEGHFGREVCGRADERPGLGDAIGAQQVCDAEVGELGARRTIRRRTGGQQDVGGLDVAMDHAARVHDGESLGELAGDARDLGGREGAVSQACGERGSVDVFHDEVARPGTGEPGIVQRDEVRMRQCGEGGCFDAYPLVRVRCVVHGRDDLDRDAPAQREVVRGVHSRHPARADERVDAVATVEHGPRIHTTSLLIHPSRVVGTPDAVMRVVTGRSCP